MAPCVLLNAVFLGTLHLLVRDQAAPPQLAMPLFGPLGQPDAFVLQIDLPLQLCLLQAQCLQTLREGLRLLIPQAFIAQTFLSQAVAPRSKLPCDLPLGGAERCALQLSRELQERCALAHRYPLVDIELGHHPGLRCKDPNQPLLRHQPAIDSRFARVVCKTN